MEYRNLTPFDDADIVGRDQELIELADGMQRASRGVVLIGERGMGKTSLARVFGRRAVPQFPGGVIFLSGAIPDRTAGQLVSAVRNESGRILLVVDDVDYLPSEELRRLLLELDEFRDTKLLLIARNSLYGPLGFEPAGFETVRLAGLTREAYRGLVKTWVPTGAGDVDDETIARLHMLASGNPHFLRLASGLVIDKQVASWGELLDRLTEFRASGPLGPTGQQLSAAAPQRRAIISDVSTTNAKILEMLQKQPELARKLGPRKFEEIVGELLALQGYKVSLTPSSDDGGFDLYAARKEGLGEFLYLVECKRYNPPNKVGVEIVRSLHGVVHSQRATAGAIVTTSFFTAGAKEFQRKNEYQIQLHDYVALSKWLTGVRGGKT
jgi:restriction system protein